MSFSLFNPETSISKLNHHKNTKIEASSFDISLKHPATWIVAGGTGSGKTHLTKQILEKRETLYCGKSPRFVVLFYKEWQPSYTEMKKSNIVDLFIHGIPEETEIKALFSKYKKYGGCYAIFDDLMDSIDQTVLNCFTVYSHHLKVSIFLLVQSLFLENKIYRVCSLNSHYIVLMKNTRDVASVSYLARQMSPYHTKYITEAYTQATKNPYSYLLFDMRQETNDIVRLRSNICSYPVSIFIESNKKRK